jgi:hypothetical protein
MCRGRIPVRSRGSKSLGLAVLALSLGAACKTYHSGDPSVPTADLDAQSYDPAPGRSVISEGGAIAPSTDAGGLGGGFGVGSGGGGGGAGGTRGDGGVKIDAPVPTGPDVPGPGADAGGGCTPCSLLSQAGCSARQGCYPSGASACCAPAGDFPENNPCGEDQQCAPGLLCINSLCLSLCDLAAPKCGPSCVPFGRYPGVGYCAP